jgi:hypothetical protein
MIQTVEDLDFISDVDQPGVMGVINKTREFILMHISVVRFLMEN